MVEITREELSEPRRQLELERVAHLKAWRVIHPRRLIGDGVGNRLAAVTGVHAPESGRAVQDAASVGRGVVHPLRFDEEPRRALERAVCRKRHPQLLE